MNIKKIGIISVLLLIPAVSFAESAQQIYNTDLSIQYLRFMFGEVEGTVVTGGGMEVLKVVLTSFNMAVMTLGAIVILYSLMVSTVNTAHDGEMLGKEWSSVWIPIRAALGFALLLPVKGSTSYAVIQVFVMWVVTQGIFAADFIWAKALDSVMAGGLKPVPVAGSSTDDNGDPQASAPYLAAQSIYLSLVCAKQAALDTNSSVKIGNENNQYQFGVVGIPDTDVCGSVDLDTSDGTYVDASNNATADMIDDLSPVADEFITSYEANVELPNNVVMDIQTGINNAGGNYTAAMTQAVAGASTTDDQIALVNKMKSSGWIMAGASFLALAQISDDQATATIGAPSTNTDITSAGSYVPDQAAFSAEMNVAQTGSIPSSMQLANPNDVNEFLHDQLTGVQELFIATLTQWTNMLSGGSNSGTYAMTNPVILLMNSGITMLRWVVGIYAIFIAAMMVVGAVAYGAAASVAGLAGAGAGWGAALMLMNFISAPVMVLFGVLAGVGITWGFYIPLIPFIVFTLGALGWIMLVIEAMVAAPLMALGVLHPEGKHTVFGEAQAGLMIVVGVFLRPPLMVIGLVAALVMSYVVVIVISIGFTPLATMIAIENWSVIGLVSMMVFYSMLVVIGLNKAFSLIYILPDRIMRWIGQPGEQSSVELDQMKQGAQEMGRGVTDTGSTGASGAGSIAQQGMSRRAAKKGKAESDNTNAGPDNKGGPSASG